MAWEGWVEYAGTEIINTSRTEAYAAGAGMTGFHAVYRKPVDVLLGDTYTDPDTDDAPWFDDDVPESADFYGCYPLSMTGIEDSTASADVIESVFDGGVVGTIRRSTRTIVFSLVLLAGSERAAEYGMRWLRMALNGGACFGRNDSRCGGNNMCYLVVAPDGGDFDDYLRTLRKVAVTNGPLLAAKASLTCGGTAWTVNMTATAGNPAEFGAEVEVVAGFMKEASPYVGGTPEGGDFDDDGEIEVEVECPVNEVVPLVDPLCPLIIPPPQVPNVDTSCFDFPESYRRRRITIPAALIPLWGEVVPKITLHARREIRNVRVRLYADPLNDGDLDTCNYCGDFVVTYIPENTTLILDGADRLIYTELANGRRQRGDSLVFASDGSPFVWPDLSCGFAYVLVVDAPDGERVPGLDLSLYPRVA